MAGTFRSLRHRNARLFFLGLLLSNIGTWVQFTAVAILVDRLTGRTTAIGVLTALQFLPMLLLGAYGGAVADQRDRRTMAMLTQGALALQAVALAMFDLTGTINLGIIYALTFALGVINAFDNPARRGFVTELVPEDDIANAISLNTATMTGSRIFGPAVAALLIGPLGTGWLFSINAISFVAILGQPVPARPVPAVPSAAGRSGVAHPFATGSGSSVDRPTCSYRSGVHRDRDLRVQPQRGVSSHVARDLGCRVLVRLGAHDDEHRQPVRVVAHGESTVRDDPLDDRQRHGARCRRVRPRLVGQRLAGAAARGAAGSRAAPGFVTSMNAITQQECPPDMRGRILALTAVAFLGSYPIGGPITGLVGDYVGLEWSLAYGAIVTLVAVAGMVWWALGRRETESRFDVLRTLLGSSTTLAPSPSEHP